MNNIKLSFLIVCLCFFTSSLFTAEDDGGISDSQQVLLNSLPPDQRENVMAKMMQVSELQSELEEFEAYVTTTERPEKKVMTAE